MKAESIPREPFLRALIAWTLVFWAAIYALLTARSLIIRPDLPIVSLAGLRALMMPVGLVVCALLFVLLERVGRLERRRKAAALAAMLALGTMLYFTINYYVFHRFPQQGAPEPNALVKIASYLIEFFWIFPAWLILYLFLRRRLRAASVPHQSHAPEGIWVKDRGSRLLVPAGAIRWIEAERDYARIHAERGSYLVRSTMAALERQFSAFHFLRIHRGVIAPARAIQAVTRLRDGRVIVTLEGGIELPAGRAYLPRLKHFLAGDPEVR